MNKSKYKCTIIGILTLVSLLMVGCQVNKKDNSSKSNTSQKNNNSTQKLEYKYTEQEINEAKEVVKNYYEALNKGDYEQFNNSLGRYKKDFLNYKKDKFKEEDIKLISINYPSKYLKNEVPSSYRSNYKENPYKAIVLNADVDEKGEKVSLDFILIKEKQDSPWLIHDWGR